MSYCQTADVLEAINFPLEGTLVNESSMRKMILQSEDEVNKICKKQFLDVAYSGQILSIQNKTITVNILSDHPAFYKKSTLQIGDKKFRIDKWKGKEITLNDVTGISNGDNFDILNLKYVTDIKDGLMTENTRGYYNTYGSAVDQLFLDYQPIYDVMSVSIDGVSIPKENLHIYKDEGYIEINKDSNPPKQDFFAKKRGIVVSYISGDEELHPIIVRAVVCFAAVRVLDSLIAGTYDDFVNIDLPGIQGSKGEHYVNIREAVHELKTEIKGIFYSEQKGSVYSARSLPTYRPLTLFA